MSDAPSLYQTTVRVSHDVLAQEVSGETVLLHLGRERYFGLNELGTRVWQLLGEHDNLGAVLARLLEEYDVEEQRLRADLEQLAQQLVEAGLLELGG
jgi:hypothetical protein